MKSDHEQKVWYALLAAIMNDRLTINNAIIVMRVAEGKEFSNKFRNRQKKTACVTAQTAY